MDSQGNDDVSALKARMYEMVRMLEGTAWVDLVCAVILQ